MRHPQVLAVDPGKKSGVVYYDSEIGALLVSDIIPDGLKGFQEWWEHYGSRYKYDVLVVESFELEEGTHGIDAADPLEIIGYLKSLNIPIVWQRRMQRGKNSVASVAVLKRAGLYPKRGELREGHQVSATQHALAFLIKQRHLPTISLLHPREEN